MARVQDLTSQKLERMRTDINGGRSYRPNTLPDPYDQQKFLEDSLQGAMREAYYTWKQVMEYHGFVWIPAQQLARFIGPRQVVVKGSVGNAVVMRHHKEGQWRRFCRPGGRTPDKKWFMGLRLDDLIRLHGTPQKFDDWIRMHDDRLRAKEKGLVVLPDQLRKQKYRGAIQTSVTGAIVVDPNAPEQPQKPANQGTRQTPITTAKG